MALPDLLVLLDLQVPKVMTGMMVRMVRMAPQARRVRKA